MEQPSLDQSTAMPSIFSQGPRSRSSTFSLNTDRPVGSRATSFMSSFSRSKTREVVDPPHKTARKAFAIKGGKRHHSFDPKAVPYPVSYDPRIVTLDVLDHLFVLQARKNNVTWVDFQDETPKRSLDIGCGSGDWVMEAAKQWKDCHFVGFDVVPIQPGPFVLKRHGIADRVQWVHGNFLTEKLPFEDNSFDHVHAYRISWGVREDQWDGLFEEIARILRPGGAIEIGEEDILFPTLPPSYTFKLKPRPAAPYRPSLTLSPPLSPVEKPPCVHAHALLESLYFGVFESRKINSRPTSIIPHYLNIHFRHVISTPYVELPMPPPPVSRQQLRHVASDCTARPPTAMRQSVSTSESSLNPSDSADSLPEQLQQQQTPPSTNSSASELNCLKTSESIDELLPSPPLPPRQPMQTVSGSFELVDPLINMTLLPPIASDLTDRNLAVHLNSVFLRILACKEAMWDELRRRLLLRNAGGLDLLSTFGWDDLEVDDDSSDSGHGDPGEWGPTREMEQARVRFEEITARFERDMLHRTALSDTIEKSLGWKKPRPEPLSKHERARQVELERAIAASARAEPEEQEQSQISRSFKGFIGFKEGRRR